MFDRTELDEAVRLQQLGFRLLWSETARHTRFLHTVLFTPDRADARSVRTWLADTRDELLDELRPELQPADLEDDRLASMLSSFRFTVAEVPVTAQQRAHHQKSPARSGYANRESARAAKVAALRELCEHLELPLIEQELIDFVDADVRAIDVTWITYGRELLRRTDMRRYKAYFGLTGGALPAIWAELKKDARVRCCHTPFNDRRRTPDISAGQILRSTRRVSEILLGRHSMT